MAVVDLDFNMEDVKSGMEAIPADQYQARIKEATLGESQAGNSMITFVWEVTDGEYIGRQVRDWVTLLTSTAWKVKPYADLIGVETGSRLDTEAFIGAEAIISVTPERGRDQAADEAPAFNKVKKLTPIS